MPQVPQPSNQPNPAIPGLEGGAPLNNPPGATPTPQPPQSNSTFFGVNPTAISDPQGQTFYKAWQAAASNPTSPLAQKFQQGVQGGQYNDMAQAAGIDTTKFPQIFPGPSLGSRLETDTNANAANLMEDATPGNASPFSAALATGGDIASEVGDLIGEPLKSVFDKLPQPVQQEFTQGIQGLVKMVASTPTPESLMNGGNETIGSAYNKLQATNPELVKNAGNMAKIAALIAGEGSDSTPEAMGENAPTGETGTGEAGSPTIPSEPISPTPLQQKFIEDEKANWSRPTTFSKAAYGDATDILENSAKNGNDIPDRLVNTGIRVGDNVDPNTGNFATSHTAQAIRDDNATLSNEMLRPALEQADTVTPKTSVQDVIDQTVDDIRNTKGITSDMKKAQISIAQSKGAALSEDYEDGMGLTDMHDEKINYAQNGKYSPVGDTEVNNNAAVNRAFGRTLGSMVETKAPEDIPVSEFNGELQNRYQMADYLDSLDGKKVPQTMWGKIANAIGKGAGATVGGIAGGGVMGEVVGYHLGGMVEDFLSSLPNKIRGYYLDNLEQSNPTAFKAVEDYMTKETAATAARVGNPSLQLPAPSYIEGQPFKGGESGVNPRDAEQFSDERNAVTSQNESDIASFKSDAEKEAYVNSQEDEANAIKELRDTINKSQTRSAFEKLTMKFKTKASWLSFANNNPALISKISSTGGTAESVWDIMHK